MRRTLTVLITTLLIISAATTITYARVDLPSPRHYVEDYANVINDNDEHSLNGILQELQQKTGAQYIILTVLSAGGLPIEQFAIELAENGFAVTEKQAEQILANLKDQELICWCHQY